MGNGSITGLFFVPTEQSHRGDGADFFKERDRRAERDDAVNALCEYEINIVVHDLQRALGHDDDVVVAEPNVVGLERSRVIQSRPDVDASGHQPPIRIAAEDNHLLEIGADVPAPRQRDRLNDGGGCV